MVKYSKEKYIKYKLKQKLLNRTRVSLTLDKDIAEAIQRNLKRKDRAFFEYKLKSYFLDQPLPSYIKIQDNNSLNPSIPNINNLIAELQEELSEMNSSMEALQKKIAILISQKYKQ